MPIELETDGQVDDDAAPGQAAYESLCAVVVDADELTLMGLLGSIQAGKPWEKLTRTQQHLCVALERELFEDDGG